MEKDIIFTGTATNYIFSIIIAMFIQSLSGAYIQYAGTYGGDYNMFILSVIGFLFSTALAFMTVFARLGYLKRNQLLVLLLLFPLVNFVFSIVLMFLSPKTKASSDSVPLKKNVNPPMEINTNEKDDEINDLKKKIEIAELKKRLKDLESE